MDNETERTTGHFPRQEQIADFHPFSSFAHYLSTGLYNKKAKPVTAYYSCKIFLRIHEENLGFAREKLDIDLSDKVEPAQRI